MIHTKAHSLFLVGKARKKGENDEGYVFISSSTFPKP